MKTVKSVSLLTGLSVRTLHYYDEIGLLKPTLINEAGYRFYDDKALKRLQQILFFRELEVPLKDIKLIMNNPDFHPIDTLQKQKELLILKRNKMNRLITLIDNTLKGEFSMSFEEFSNEDMETIFRTMLTNLDEEQRKKMEDQYGSIDEWKDTFIQKATSTDARLNMKKAMEYYGDKDKMIEAVQNPINPVKMDKLQEKTTELFKLMVQHKEDGIESLEMKNLVNEYEELYKEVFHMDNVNLLLYDMGQFYTVNEEVMKVNDAQYGEGASIFIGEVLMHYNHV